MNSSILKEVLMRFKNGFSIDFGRGSVKGGSLTTSLITFKSTLCIFLGMFYLFIAAILLPAILLLFYCLNSCCTITD